MTPGEIRDQLIAQHDGLRARIDAARLASEKWACGEVPPSHVRKALSELADALRAHNLHEERALQELIRSMDPWGPALEELMDDGHVREHRNMLDALAQVSDARDPREGGRQLEKFCERVLDHMTWEERALLNVSLGDDESIDAERS